MSSLHYGLPLWRVRFPKSRVPSYPRHRGRLDTEVAIIGGGLTGCTIAYVFAAADFGFADVNDSPANSLLAVKITTLPASGSLTPSHVYADNGTYTVTLTVTDDDGGSTSDSLVVPPPSTRTLRAALS